jgi:hypothetical protein
MQCPKCDNIVTVKTSVGSRKCLRCLFEWWGTTPTEAKKIWGDAMSDEDLKKWLELKNKRNPELDDPTIPEGATIEIDAKTGKAVPRDNY